jgi:hypothetical protein
MQAIERHNSWRPDPTNLDAVNAYNQEAWTYNAQKAQLESQLKSSNADYTPAKDAVRTDIPSWTQPAPEQPHPSAGQPQPNAPPQVSKVPLQTDRGQIESKYKHSQDFGVTDPRGSSGFDKFDKALKQVVDDPKTMHIQGTYRGQPAILNYNPDTGVCVIQSPDGSFISGWKLSPIQVQNVLGTGALGGGD